MAGELATTGPPRPPDPTAALGTLGSLLRAGMLAIPGASALPVIGGRRAADLTNTQSLTLDYSLIDQDRLATYARVCGFPVRDRLPVTFLHVLAFPLQLRLVSDPTFPLPAVGLVHVHNRIVQHRAVDAREPVSITVRALDLRPHRRGRQFDIVTEARVGDELVWDEVSTNLSVESSRAPTAEKPADDAQSTLPATARWRLRGDLGRRYAAVSGDFNPIHLHPLTARLFGFPAAIAHGMWTTARCLAQLDAILPEAPTVEVAFKRPLLLPASVEFAERRDDDGTISFAVRDAAKAIPHLDGRCYAESPKSSK